MKVRDFLKAIEEQVRIDESVLEKEITCFDYSTDTPYETPSIPTVVDWSDKKYVDIVFNYTE